MVEIYGKRLTSYGLLIVLFVLLIVALMPQDVLLAFPKNDAVRLVHEDIVFEEAFEVEHESSMMFSECNVFGINKLIKDYYDAYIAQDDIEILKVMDTFGNLDISKRKFAQENVEQYMNTRCYFMEASIEDAYLVVSYGYAKYRGIETAIPEIGMFFVRMNSSGNYYICNRAISNEISAYNQTMFEMNAVTSLRENAQYELESACEVDLKLSEFVNKNQEFFKY